jgi:hypothetical protein
LPTVAGRGNRPQGYAASGQRLKPRERTLVVLAGQPDIEELDRPPRGKSEFAAWRDGPDDVVGLHALAKRGARPNETFFRDAAFRQEKEGTTAAREVRTHGRRLSATGLRAAMIC